MTTLTLAYKLGEEQSFPKLLLGELNTRMEKNLDAYFILHTHTDTHRQTHMCTCTYTLLIHKDCRTNSEGETVKLQKKDIGEYLYELGGRQ